MKKQFLYMSFVVCQAMVAMEPSKRQFAVPALASPDMPTVSTLRSAYSLDRAIELERAREQARAAQLAAKLTAVAAAQETQK